MFCYSKHVMFRRNINMTSQTVGACVLVCFAPLCYYLLTTHLYWFTLHCVTELHLWWCHWEKLTKELLVRFLGLLVTSSVALGLLASLAVSSGLNWPCRFVCGDCWKDWTAAADSYLVFATGLNCWYPDNEYWARLPRTISRQVYLFCIWITYLFHYFWWVVG